MGDGRQGIHVYGAASIGALRAAELDVFGMRGIGRIYEDFRDGVFEDDDEVAVLHGPEELGYPPLTEAMVNIRATFEAAAIAGMIDAALSAPRLTDIAKGLFYKARSYEAVLQAAAASEFPAATSRRLSTWLPQGRVDRKREDAEAMLAAIRAHLDAGVTAAARLLAPCRDRRMARGGGNSNLTVSALQFGTQATLAFNAVFLLLK